MAPPRTERITLRCRRADCPNTTEVTRSGAERLKSYELTDDGPTFLCHPHNTYEVAQPTRHGNKLKRLVLAHLSQTELSKSGFAAKIGITPSSFRWWLDDDDRMTSRANLERIANALGITSIDEAIRLQGGTAEERQRELAMVKIEAQNKRVAEDPALAQAMGDHMANTVRGTHHSEDHRDGIRRALKGYRQKPDAHLLHVLGDVTDPTTGATTKQSPEELLALRLMTTLRHHLRATPNPTDQAPRQWAEMASGRYRECIGTVISAWNRQLRKRTSSQIGGRPADVERCGAVRTYLSSKPRPYGMWALAPAPEKWADEHARGCPALRETLREARGTKSGRNPLGLSADATLGSGGLSAGFGSAETPMLE